MATEIDRPLVSIISFCKNRAFSIGRSVESVLNQSYPNFEFVVQDGASTDGTLEILRAYASRDSRIKLVSETDSGPAEAYWKVLHRCQGDIIGTCLSDEELVPDAVEFAVKTFRSEPDLGAITCDGYNTDEHGKILSSFVAGDFDFIIYLFGRYAPFWPGSFFRRQALIDVGLNRPGWTLDSLEFEIWCRLATDHLVKYIPRPISKYAIHKGQLSNTPHNFNEHIRGRLNVIERLFSKDGFFGDDEYEKLKSMIAQLDQFLGHVRAYAMKKEERILIEKIESLTQTLALIKPPAYRLVGALSSAQAKSIRQRLDKVWSSLSRIIPPRMQNRISARMRSRARWLFFTMGSIAMSGKMPVQEARRAQDYLHYLWARLALATPSSIRRRLPPRLKNTVRHQFQSSLLVLSYLPGYITWFFVSFFTGRSKHPKTGAEGFDDLPDWISFYPRAAATYDARGQTVQALEMWRRAEPLQDPNIDGLACQALLKLPEATYESIARFQCRWAKRYAKVSGDAVNPQFRVFDGNRKIRVGYHCSFMDGDTIRFIMRNAIVRHDRSKFQVYGYSPVPVSADIKSAFDVLKITTAISDPEFVELVRSDEIDIFVEMSGFSPGHRFIAMASRCAPIQISYLNHHGTSCVRAVDYFLSDEISTPLNSDADRTFTEKIYRLPKCLLCYDYKGYDHPAVGDPPSTTRGYVTFGCFGSGGKINLQVIEWWAELLRRVPGSRFYIRNRELTPPDNRRYMLDRFQRFGIDPARIELAGEADRVTVLHSYADVDITMDTWPYCGGNTIAESLWQGVPVVTLMGSRISSRYGASLLTAAGCSDLIGHTVDEYLNIAVKLAGDSGRLRDFRQNLRLMSEEFGLGDSAQFALDLERAYEDMLQKCSS